MHFYVHINFFVIFLGLVLLSDPDPQPDPDPKSDPIFIPRQVPIEIFLSSCLDKSDVELGEAVAEEERPEVVLLEQELQHVQARLLMAPVHTRPSNAKKFNEVVLGFFLQATYGCSKQRKLIPTATLLSQGA